MSNSNNTVYEKELNRQYEKANEDEVSIDDNSVVTTYVSINDINSIQETNTGQLNVSPEMRYEINPAEPTTNNPYNLRTRPTKRNSR